jgi:hypothetical protein
MLIPMASFARTVARLRESRERTARLEAQLQHELSLLITGSGVGLRQWAEEMGITPAYACDLRHGRRKVSEAIIEKVLQR